MNSAKPIFFACLFAIIALVALLFFRGRGRVSTGEARLVLHCAAGLRLPVTEIAELYGDEIGDTIHLQFAGSGELASQLEIAGGDLYLPADMSYIEQVQAKGLAREAIPAVYLTAGIAVAKGNPKNIQSLADLQRGDVRVSLANPSAAIGKFTKKVLSQLKLWDSIEVNATVFKITVNDIAQDVSTGAADAAVVWDAVAGLFEDLDFIRVEEFDQRRQRATIGVLASSDNPTAALRFARFLTAADRGLRVFEKHGFQVVEGDSWALHPEIAFFSGAMLQRAVEQQLRLFEEREGVTVRPVYDGCGTLVNTIKAGAQPDAYFSCDLRFLELVQDQFEEGTIVSKNDMVLLVEKGNPRKIAKLQDLLRPGLKVGMAHPEKSALGTLTVELLKRHGLYGRLQEANNIEVLASKGDELVNQMQIGALDVAIVYRSNSLSSEQILQRCEAIPIANGPQAAQPFAVGRGSNHRQLVHRLKDFLTGAAGKEEFLKYGFHWELAN